MNSFSFNLSLPVVKETPQQVVCRTPEDVYGVLKDTASLAQESFMVLSLNAKYRLIDRHLVGLGLVDACLVAPREVFAPAILSRSSAVVLVHNHPSGDPTPSAEDIRITRQLVEAGKILSIEVLDHVIIGRGATPFTSLRETGLVAF